MEFLKNGAFVHDQGIFMHEPNSVRVTSVPDATDVCARRRRAVREDVARVGVGGEIV